MNSQLVYWTYRIDSIGWLLIRFHVRLLTICMRIKIPQNEIVCFFDHFTILVKHFFHFICKSKIEFLQQKKEKKINRQNQKF